MVLSGAPRRGPDLVPGRAAAGRRRPSVADWSRINRSVPRLVDVLPNGPTHYATVQVFLAGGAPEVMLHLRAMGLLDENCLTSHVFLH